MKTIVIIWVRFGPYHLARLRAAAQLFDSENIAVVAVELIGKDSTYDWSIDSSSSGFERVTLFPDSDYKTLSQREIARALTNKLDEISPDSVAVGGWVLKPARAAIAWCRRNSRTAVMLSESQAGDFPVIWWKERIKRRIVRACDSFLVGGTPHKKYAVSLGSNHTNCFMGYDVVDNKHFKGCKSLNISDLTNQDTIKSLPEKYFLASGRLTDKKNFPFLIKSYKEYKYAAGNDAWKLVLLGDGPLKPALLKLISSLDLEGDITMPGFIQYDELRNYYGLSQAFLHPSSMEQWGLVVNEAMAAGLPVLVSTRTGCHQDLVQEGVNGFTFSPFKTEEIVDAMLKMTKSSDSKRSAMGKCSKEIISKWDLDRFANGLKSAVSAGENHAKQRTHGLSLLDKAILSA